MWRSEWWVAGRKTMYPGQLPLFQDGFRVEFLLLHSLWGAVLSTVGCEAAFLAPTHSMPEAPPVETTTDVHRQCPVSPGGRIPLQ